jgi:hypothetical protein
MPQLDVLNTKTVRFTKIVEAAGKPEPYTLWTDPARDSDFQKAIRQQRVMTVLRRHGKPDAAVAGYLKNKNALYLLFPKSLEQFTQRRVVGLKYDLLTESKARGKPVKIVRRKPSPPPPRSQRATVVIRKPEPEQPTKAKTVPTFRVQARVVATVDREVEVQATNQRQARVMALKTLKEQPTDLSADSTEIRIKRVSRKS